MSTSPANFHDWEYERASEKEFKRDMEQRSDEIADAISERISDLEMSSGHGADEQTIMGRVLMDLCEKEIDGQSFRTYLFKLWKHRNAYDDEGRRKISRAAQGIANTIALPLRSIVSSDIHKEFGA